MRRLFLWALVLLAVATGLLAVALWRSHMPAAPDWRAQLAAQECVQVAGVLAAAIDADVPEAFGYFDRLFLAEGSRCGDEDLVVAEKANWLIGSLPQTREDLLARSARATTERDTWPGPVRRAVLLLTGWQPSFPGPHDYQYEDAYSGIGFVTRLRLVWLTLGCDPVMESYGGPDWHALEARLQPSGKQWRAGVWNERATACATEVADLIDRIGIGATGPQGDLVAGLLVAAPFTAQHPRIAYLKAQRALDHKLAPTWLEPDSDGMRLKAQGVGDLYAAAMLGHPQAMVRIGRMALAGDMVAAMEDMSASDERVAAFVFLSLAQDAGAGTQDDVNAAADLLSADERRLADERLASWRDELGEMVVKR